MDLQAIADFALSLSPSIRKELITLARSQCFPELSDTVLLSKTQNILNTFTKYPPYRGLASSDLNLIGENMYTLITSSLTAGLVITLVLDAPYTPEQASTIISRSFTKEFSATQTLREESTWDWSSFFPETHHDTELKPSPHRMFPTRSALQSLFTSNLHKITKKYRNRIVRPHYTTKGISSETTEWLISHQHRHKITCGSRRGFMSSFNPRNPTSRDVVHFYMRTGVWPKGRVEMKQRWYPTGLVPRTYFAWGGDAIAVSAYLRDFFNVVADFFPPTHRKLRVQPDWLRALPSSLPLDEPRFFFYDLTSFTSWFHEHEPFLQALSAYFANTPMLTLETNFHVHVRDIGAMIDEYRRIVNDFPEFYVSSTFGSGLAEAFHNCYHRCAGFLGVPGNLITCTIPHGLAQAEGYTNERSLQVPGDDVGCITGGIERLLDKKAVANTLGVLQMEKVYRSDEASVYLKRGVRASETGVDLVDMVIYPVLSFVLDPSQEELDLSPIYRYPRKDEFYGRSCRVFNQLIRDLWKLRKGVYDDSELELLQDYFDLFHKRAGLPLGPILQGSVLYGDHEEGVGTSRFTGVGFKYPGDTRMLRSEPDELFAQDFVHSFAIREVDPNLILEEIFEPIAEGTYFTVYGKRGWSFMEDMGMIRAVEKTAGEVFHVVGEDAKRAFMNHKRPKVRTYQANTELSLEVLAGAGVLPSAEGLSFLGSEVNVAAVSVVSPLTTSFFSSDRYIDLDQPAQETAWELDYGEDIQMESMRRDAGMPVGGVNFDFLLANLGR